MNRMLLILFVAVPFGTARCQDQRVIDSVTSLIKNDGSRNDMEIFYELGFQYGYNNHTLSLQFLDKGLPIAYRDRYSLMIVKMSRFKAQVLRRAGRSDEALALFASVLPIATRHKWNREIGFILRSLSVLYVDLGKFDVSLEHSFRALDVWTEEGDMEGIASTLNNIGLVHYKVGNYDKAIEYYQKSLSIAESNKLRTSILLNYSNTALANIQKEYLPEASRWIEKCFAACQRGCPNEVVIAAEFSAGYVAFHSNYFDSAKQHFETSRRLSVVNDDPRFETENLIMLAEIERVQKNHLQAEQFLSTALENSTRRNYRFLREVTYRSFYKLYKSMDKERDASIFLEKYVALRDSINSLEARNRIMVQQIEFEQRENKLMIASREQAVAAQKMRVKLIAVICVLLVAFVVTLFLRLRDRQKVNQMLDQRVADRTRELERNREALERAYVEQNELIRKTSKSIKSVLATQKGLHATALQREGLPNNSEPLEIIELRTLAEQLGQSNTRSD